jgi:hypothetical protein
MIKNSKILLGVSSGSLVLLLILAFLLLGSLNNLASEKEEIRERILALDTDLKNLKVLESFLIQTQEERGIIEPAFVRGGDFVPFIEDLERVGAESSVEVRVESAILGGSAAAPKEPSFRLTAEGSFSSLFRYMLLLENLPYEIAFGEVRFVKNLNESGEGIWIGTFIINLKSYEI